MQQYKFIFQEWMPITKMNTPIETPQVDIIPDTDQQSQTGNCNIRNSIHLLSLTIRRNILNARLKQTFTITQLSEKVGVSKNDIIAFEKGTEFPNAIMIEKLEEVLFMRLRPI
tara:strand:+ start:643 stop:981 length:339 start_codon:yes stop_codon:yes gene_type:complete